jgi:hypothetical protein
MAKYAYVKEDSYNTLGSGGNITLTLLVTFWDDADLENPRDASVYATFDIDALLFGADDAIVDAMVAYASSEWSWTLPRNHCVFRSLQRGTIV